ncbi:MAG: acyltransferase family protein, partial [Leptolyngbyaceae cyanobacterium MAG.088]|nr:acyltransferase family protein [Leptolyngbyaceae cyanobacterium MAG.088]
FLEKSRQLSIRKLFVVLGASSFAIYLTHYPILSIFTKAIQVTGIDSIIFRTIGMVLACIVTILIGCIVHFSIEKKITSTFRNHLIYKRA